ncbi:glyoxalase [Niastella koreensis]|uniref:Glyoxalase/bleomycin resistance protein/dioxygenase n=2 Tax=Niastella koreensis TaxID=354356 RepID=G8TEN7_NIAKG|nr:VOC family protein [Niastella koreensis]AEW00473.1 Glyoxalase/bleomycin resistance protein/dioxygenase [Niastella koreensis GR20-10]OQP52458.1 glyoxalase [Niastella koreensis]
MGTLTFQKVFNTFSVDDLDKAFDFYTGKLNLDVSRTPMNTLTLNIPGNQNGMMIYEKDNHEPATYTVLNFGVKDVEAAVDELTARGVVFEQYDNGPLKTDKKGISRGDGPVIAWFKDPAGNFLSVIENN